MSAGNARLELRRLLDTKEGCFAPLVLNPLMAKLAEEAGFSAGYLGGGAMGFLTCATEANLSLTQMVQAGLDIRSQSALPLILDGTCGWGDPVHVRHTIRTAEAAGFAAIEIEDQILPKRVHHHIGVEHLIPCELMEQKISEAVAARVDPHFLIIARTNAARVTGLDEALQRAEAYHRAGADILLVMPRNLEEARSVGSRLPRPLMYMVPTGGLGAVGISLSELSALGFSLIVDPGTPFFAMAHALRQSYAALRAGRSDPILGSSGVHAEEKAVHTTIGLETLLEIERRTVER
jgi:methylisocitrate lyase